MQGILRRLHRGMEALGGRWQQSFTELFTATRETLEAGAPAEPIAKRMDTSARLAYFAHFQLSAGAQSKMLGASKVAQGVLDTGVVRAKHYASLVTERALAVLGRNTIAVESYAKLVVGELGMTALNEAFVVASVAERATHKQFTRIGVSEVQRSHSRLEGRIIPIGAMFEMDGYRVPYPHHPSLPLKHRIHCKHAVVGVRVRGRGSGVLSRIASYGVRAR